MQITKTEYRFDGSPTEFKEVAYLFESKAHGSSTGGVSFPVSEALETPAVTAVPTAKPILTEGAVKAVFQKRKLTSDQAMVVKAVYEAGEKGTTTEDIAAATGFDRGTVKATLRLLGKRVHHTSDWPAELRIFHQKWEGSCYRYWMHSAMRIVLDSGDVKL